MARTSPSRPESSAAQVLPFQQAIRLAVMPPALVKLPPTYTLLPLTAMASTLEFNPLPTVDQLRPFQRARLVMRIPPAAVNTPPIYASPPLMPIACAPPRIPNEPKRSSQWSSPVAATPNETTMTCGKAVRSRARKHFSDKSLAGSGKKQIRSGFIESTSCLALTHAKRPSSSCSRGRSSAQPRLPNRRHPLSYAPEKQRRASLRAPGR